LLGRLAAQPLHGPRVMLLLNKLLPPGLAAAIRDGPGQPPALTFPGMEVVCCTTERNMVCWLGSKPALP